MREYLWHPNEKRNLNNEQGDIPTTTYSQASWASDTVTGSYDKLLQERHGIVV